ncbi:unnamed protein product, partial [marine sediment metagenome]
MSGGKFPPSPLARGQAARLLEHCGKGRAGKRNAAILAVLWRCGLRSDECAHLELDDLVELDGGAMRVTVRRPKGGRKEKNPTPPRIVGLDPQGAEYVRDWLKERGELVGSRLVFVTRTGKRVHTS